MLATIVGHYCYYQLLMSSIIISTSRYINQRFQKNVPLSFDFQQGILKKHTFLTLLFVDLNISISIAQ